MPPKHQLALFNVCSLGYVRPVHSFYVALSQLQFAHAMADRVHLHSFGLHPSKWPISTAYHHPLHHPPIPSVDDVTAMSSIRFNSKSSVFCALNSRIEVKVCNNILCSNSRRIENTYCRYIRIVFYAMMTVVSPMVFFLCVVFFCMLVTC